MSQGPLVASLTSRAVVRVGGPDWRSFLHNLLTHDVENLPVGEARFCGLLTPQGRLLYDLFIVALDDGCLIDVAAEHRAGLIQRLKMYKLRAKVEIVTDDMAVAAAFYAHPRESGDPVLSSGELDEQAEGQPGKVWIPAFAGMSGVLARDPRLSALGYRYYGLAGDQSEAAYDAHRLALGVPGAADWGSDKTYPIEANFDLLNGIDFKKGCFVGQETTSRMHRRGAVKTRMAPIVFDGAPPVQGAEILNGDLRAGEVLSGIEARAMASLRLDRLEGRLTVDDRPVSVEMPPWMQSAIGA